MSDRFLEALRDWQTFYLLAGGAAAALIGLLLIAVSLAHELAIRTEYATMRAFVTPAVVHFVMVLFVSAFCVMPIQKTAVLGVLILLAGMVGLFDTVASITYLWRQRQERLTDWEDWFWRVALPLAISLALVASGGWLIAGSSDALPWLAGITSVLLAMAIRNAWALVTWIVEHPNDPPNA